MISKYVSFGMTYNLNDNTSSCNPIESDNITISQTSSDDFSAMYVPTVNKEVYTTGLSFAISYENDDEPAFNPDAPLYNGQSAKDLIETYLASWAPSVFAGGFKLTLLVTFNYVEPVGNLITLATGGAYIFTVPNNDPTIQNRTNIPLSYNFLNVGPDPDEMVNCTSSAFVRPILKYWGFVLASPPEEEPDVDLILTINTWPIRSASPSLYDYSDNFTNNENLLSFKGVLIHEIMHALGFLQGAIVNSGVTSPLYYDVSLFRNSNLPSSFGEYADGNTTRIGNGSLIDRSIPEGTYGLLSLSYLGSCTVPIDNNSPGHLRETEDNRPQTGIMEPLAELGGCPFTINDGTGLQIVGWANPFVCCYSGNSNIMIRDKQTKKISEIRVRDLLSNLHEVYDTRRKKYVAIKYNAVMNTTKKFILIKKGSLDKGMPNEDFYVTAGHHIMYGGVSTKARDIPGAVRVNVEPENVYSVCTDIKRTISINNLEVRTWSHDEWMAKVAKSDIEWTDNRVKILSVMASASI